MFYIIFPILVALAAASTPYYDYRQIEISNGEEVLFQSPGYPYSSPVGTRIAWDIMIRDTRRSRLVITCHDIRIEQSRDCELGYLSVYNGEEETKQCGTLQEFAAASEHNFARITFDLYYARGLCNCRIYAVGIDNGDQTMSANEEGEEEEQLQEMTELPMVTETARIVTEPETILTTLTTTTTEMTTTTTTEPPGPPVDLREYVINLKAEDPPNEQLELGPIPVNTDYKWSINTIPGHRISFYCQHYKFEPCRVEKGYLMIDDGIKQRRVCNNGSFATVAISTNNVLNLEYKSHPNNTGLSMKCLVQAITGEDEFEFRNRVSEEVDSTENGRIEGPRSTSCKCGYSSKNRARIVNGKIAIDGEYPWMAGLYYVPWGMPICGGSIITEYHVLTAAHCMHSDKPEDFQILVGAANSSAAQRLEVQRIIVHQGYNASLLNLHDITIIQVTQQIQFSKMVGPICLTDERLMSGLHNKYVTIMGWGMQSNSDIFHPRELLLKAHTRVVDVKSCSYTWFGTFDTPGMNRLCIWSKRYSACGGDSGGPIVWVDPETNRYTQIGVNSMGRGCKLHYPSISPIVPDYINWILDVIKATNQRGNICYKV